MSLTSLKMVHVHLPIIPPRKQGQLLESGVGGVSIKVPYFDLQLSRNWSLRSWKENTPTTDLQNTYKFVYPKI